MAKDIDNRFLDEDERITAYLRGKMETDEEALFISELQANPDLKAKAIAMARLVKGMKEVGAKRDEEIKEAFLSSTMEGVEKAARNASASKKARVITLRQASAWMSIAASVIFIVWIGIGYNDYRATMALADEYATAFDTSIYSRGEDSSSKVEQKLARLFDNVKNKKDLKNTLHELSLCWELSRMQTYNDYTEYSAEIGWNLVIGYLKDNDKKKAKVVLEGLVKSTEKGSTINTEAEEVLRQIK